LIALIANARRSVRLPRLRKLSLPQTDKTSRFDSAVYGPTLKTEAGLALDFSKDQFCFNASGALAVKLDSRLDSNGAERLRDATNLAARALSPGRSTECVSSSQCQIVIARPLKRPRTRSWRPANGKPFHHRRKIPRPGFW